MNSNAPRNSNLASELHRNYLFKFKLVLSSVRSNSHMMAPRCANRLWQSCSVSTPAANIGWNCTASIRFERWLQLMFQEKPNIYHIPEPIIRGFLPKLVLLCSHWLIQLCNEGFAAFFVQSCDRFLFPFHLFFHFSRSFLNFFLIVVKFLIKQYSTRACWISNDYNELGAARLVGYLSFDIQFAFVE